MAQATLATPWIRPYIEKVVNDYVLSDNFRKSLDESINFDAAQLNNRVEAAKKKIIELNDNPTINQLKQKINIADSKIADLENNNSLQLEEIDNLEQYTRRTNIRMYRIPEVTN
jgi:hypothetical protein